MHIEPLTLFVIDLKSLKWKEFIHFWSRNISYYNFKTFSC